MLLSPEDSEKLVLAANQGTVQFIMRNSDDQAQLQQPPAQLKDLITGAAQPTTPVKVKKAPAPAQPRNVYEIETYDGTKKNTVKF
jgi:pilus assembly protein CpaB